MKKKIALFLCAMLLLGTATGCRAEDKAVVWDIPVSHVTEVGTKVTFVALSDRMQNVTGYDVQVFAPNGEKVAYEGQSFIPMQTGTYTITYTANGEKGMVAQKSTLVTVLPAEAPQMTVKQNIENIVWQYGKTYRIPSVMVTDNVDTNLPYEVTVKDGLGRVAQVKDGKITPSVGGFYTLDYIAYDEAGNKGQKSVSVYCTDENEISRFESPQLLTMFSAVDDNGEKNVTWEMSYNMDSNYTYGNSKGSLRMHYDETSENSWPGIELKGDSMANANLYQSDVDGIRFKMYLTGNISAKQDVWVFVYSSADSASENFVEARFNLRTYLDDFGFNKWFEFSLNKEELATMKNANTGAVFEGEAIYRIKIWTMVEGEGKYMDMYLDDFEYFVSEEQSSI